MAASKAGAGRAGRSIVLGHDVSTAVLALREFCSGVRGMARLHVERIRSADDASYASHVPVSTVAHGMSTAEPGDLSKVLTFLPSSYVRAATLLDARPVCRGMYGGVFGE